MGKWELLVQKAYDNYGNDSYDRFLFRLDYLPKVAVHLANFDNQVQNGGLSQWIFNDYVSHHKELFYSMNEVEKFLGEHGVVATLMSDIRLKLMSIIDDCCDPNDLMIDEEDEDVMNCLDEFDTWYYSVSDSFQSLVNKFFDIQS